MDSKQCSICDETKLLTEFYSQKKTRKDGTEYIYYNPECKECTKERSIERRMKNHEKYCYEMREYQRHRRKTDKRVIEETRRHAKEQKESGYAKEYYEKNREYFSQYNKERRQRKEHEISDFEWVSCKEYFDNSCAYCGLHIGAHYIKYAGKLKKTDLHKEHVDDKGSNKIDNCVPSCQLCNSSKWAFELGQWYNEENENFSSERLNKIINWITEDHKNYKGGKK